MPEVWRYHREQLWGVRSVLRLLAEEHAGGADLVGVHVGTTTGALDGNVQAAMQKQGGTVSKAFTYINRPNVSAMRIFYGVTQSQQRLFLHRERHVKNLHESRAADYAFISGGWRKEIHDIVYGTMLDVGNMKEMCLLELHDGENDQRCREALEFMSQSPEGGTKSNCRRSTRTLQSSYCTCMPQAHDAKTW